MDTHTSQTVSTQRSWNKTIMIADQCWNSTNHLQIRDLRMAHIYFSLVTMMRMGFNGSSIAGSAQSGA